MIHALLLASLTAFAGPADRAFSLSDAKTQSAQNDAAHKAAKMGARIPKKMKRRVAPRAAAWVAVGRLQVLDEQIAKAAHKALISNNNADGVRADAAWAMGEISRERAWAEVKPLSESLQQAMRAKIDAATAYHVVEAFGKVYTPHDHSFEENLAATKALNALAANQTTRLPPIYYVVMNRVLTFDVAIRLLRDEVQEARAERSEQNIAEAYNAVLTTVRWMASRQEQLIAGYADEKSKIEGAFDALLGALEVRDRRLALMLVWSLGNVAKEPVFADLVGQRVGGLVTSKDDTVRIVTSWSLYRLRTSMPARKAMREQLLSHEADARIFAMLAAMRTDPKEMDAVQKLYAVEPAK
jgi:hypothetical protein